MSTIHLHQTTTATPEQFIAGLTDFGPGRSKLFGNSADGYLKVHDRGPHEADVTEGSVGVWQRTGSAAAEVGGACLAGGRQTLVGEPDGYGAFTGGGRGTLD